MGGWAIRDRPGAPGPGSRTMWRRAAAWVPRSFGSTPAVATPQVLAYTQGALFATGGLLVLLMAWFGPPGAHLAALRLLAGTAIATGLGLACFGVLLPRWAWHCMAASGTALITVAIPAGGGGVVSLALTPLYLFVALNVFFFFAWGSASLHLLSTVLCCVVTLHALNLDGGGESIILGGVILTAGCVCAWLVAASAAAEIDSLTGLVNRRGLDRALQDAMSRAQRAGPPLSLALIDVDRFKTVNDTHGHLAGDRLLKDTALAWSRLLGDETILARYGGDEFAVLVPGLDSAAAVALIDQLRAATTTGHTCSAGIAEWEPGDSASLLMSRADTALYNAKHLGRDRTVAHDVRGPLVDELRKALTGDDFQVVYQPIVNLRDGRITGVEALARWHHPQRGQIPPDEFIPLAEESGLITLLDAVVLERACRTAAPWMGPGRLESLTVNVSGAQLLETGYAHQVKSILAGSGLDPSHLILEITERTLAADSPAVIHTLEQLRAVGVRFAIDDFGTGFSCLSRLERLPIDVLKIDRSFIMAIKVPDAAAPLVDAILGLARALDLSVIAEGIEHDYQQQRLQDLGCLTGQGYHLGRPAPSATIDTLLAAHAAGAEHAFAG